MKKLSVFQLLLVLAVFMKNIENFQKKVKNNRCIYI